jgi:hypothetical protein
MYRDFTVYTPVVTSAGVFIASFAKDVKAYCEMLDLNDFKTYSEMRDVLEVMEIIDLLDAQGS